jgi:uncharacterized tellurite resistance protein B-like protein
MIDDSSLDYYAEPESVISDDLKFKSKLGIGENAYKSLKIKNTVGEIWDTLGAAATGATMASSASVATTFFAQNALFAALGIASTPIGWVIAAGVLSGGAWLGVTRQFKKLNKERVDVIPQFINTPLDILGLALFDLLAPLALKIANIDGQLDQSEVNHIKSYFVNKWGYDANFVNSGIHYINQNIDNYKISSTAKALVEYKKSNPDCDYESMSKEILTFLYEIVEADGRIDEREMLALNSIKSIFNEPMHEIVRKDIKKGILDTRKIVRKGMANARKNLRGLF